MSTISDLLAALAPQLTNEHDAYGLVHDIGHALPSLTDDALRELGNHLVQITPDDPRIAAVVATLVEIVDGYRLGRRQTVTLSLREGINRDVLCALERQPATTSELAKAIERDESQISRALTRLRELDLVDPPQREAADRRRIEHRLSLGAKQALGRLDSRARKAPVWQLSVFDSHDELAVSVDEEPKIDSPASAKVTDAFAATTRLKARPAMARLKAPPPSYVPLKRRRARAAAGPGQPLVERRAFAKKNR